MESGSATVFALRVCSPRQGRVAREFYATITVKRLRELFAAGQRLHAGQNQLKRCTVREMDCQSKRETIRSLSPTVKRAPSRSRAHPNFRTSAGRFC